MSPPRPARGRKAAPQHPIIGIVGHDLHLDGGACVPQRLLLATIVLPILLTRPACAETVYEFVSHCKEEGLADCFRHIEERLIRLNSGEKRRICLPPAFGTALFATEGIPVSLLEHVRLGLSAARFGNAGQDVDEVISRLVSEIYACG